MKEKTENNVILQRDSDGYPTTTRKQVINGKKYIVVSHYVGTKDLKKIILDLAFKQAFRDMESHKKQTD